MPEVRVPANFKPRAHQVPVMRFFDNGGKRYSGIWHRRAGKDRAMLAQASKMAHIRIGLYWHCLPTLKQARKAVWDNITGDGLPLMRATFPNELVKKRIEDEMKIELRCGSIIQLVGSDNFDSLVGANPLHVTFSEWPLTHPLAWEYTRPILTENGGTAAFIGTPRGYNHGYRTHEIAKRSDGWMSETYTIDDTGIMSREQYLKEIEDGMPEELARQEYLCDFSAANVGSVLGKWIEEAEREGRIHDGVEYDYDGNDIIIVSDIGFYDAAAWWVVQPCPQGFYALDYYEQSGMDADDWVEHWKTYLTDTGMRLGKIWLPHDARVKTFQSKRSSVETFLQAFGSERVGIVPSTSKSDRINAGRKLARRTAWHSERCARGVQMLRDWSYEYNEETKSFSREPKHDYASHGGDAWSYVGVVCNDYVERAKPEEKPLARGIEDFTLEELWVTAPRRSGGRI